MCFSKCIDALIFKCNYPGEHIALNKRPSRGCPSLVLISLSDESNEAGRIMCLAHGHNYFTQPRTEPSIYVSRNKVLTIVINIPQSLINTFLDCCMRGYFSTSAEI